METKLDMSIIFSRLADMEVASIGIRYDGSGDNGEIHSVDYADVNGCQVKVQDNEIRDILERLCYDDLLDQVGDWVNNDGGYGTVTIDVKTGDYSIESHQRVTDTIDESFSGSIKDSYEEDI